jgi:peptidoglycan hydrolase-like protein with peptidoglycan-binding domain
VTSSLDKRWRRSSRGIALGRLFGLVVVGGFLVSCGDTGGSDRFSGETAGETDEPLASKISVTPSEAPRDATSSLAIIEDGSATKFSTGILDHSCGKFAMLQSKGYPILLKWSDSDWLPIEGASTSLDYESGIDVDQSWSTDLTGDGDPEIVLSLAVEGANRGFGQILSANRGDCAWRYLSAVDGCSTSEVLDDLVVDGDTAIGTGFVSCGDGRDSVTYEWLAQYGLFVAGPASGGRFCPSLVEDLDLPLSNCSEGWAVSMAQEKMVAEGIFVEIDGQYGPGTQRAVLEYQQMNDLPLTGQVDPLTWATMYPVDVSDDGGWNYYPDYDGDGVSSPREIGHASGALEYYEASSPIEPSRRQKPVVVGTYCETRTSGLTSDMRGPLIDYVLVTEYSNGYKTFQTVGSSWANFPGKCG